MQQLFLPEISNVPPLANGDHLSRAEFERRYHAMPTHKKRVSGLESHGASGELVLSAIRD